MDKKKINLLSSFEFTCLIIAFFVDANIATLPNEAIKLAKQDGWISTIIGSIYPFYVVMIAIFISNKFPRKNILEVSRKYLGKYIGNTLNILFIISLISYLPGALSMANVIFRVYVVPFLSSNVIYISMLALGLYTAKKGIKVIAKITVLNFYILAFIVISSVAVIGQGSILNIMPIFGSGYKNILASSLNSTYNYVGAETILLFYPLIKDSKDIKKASLRAVAMTTISYTWIVFISIFYLSIDIIPKTIWAFFSVTEAIQVDVINSFRYIFIILWILTALKSIAIVSFTPIYMIDDIRNKKSGTWIYFALGIICFLVTNKFYLTYVDRAYILGYTVPISAIYNIFYITFIAILVFIKKDDRSEKN